MKSQIKRLGLCTLLLIWAAVQGMAQIYTDLPTGAAVVMQTQTLGNELDKSKKAQQTTAATNITMAVTLDSIRKYDKIMLDYLSEVDTAFLQIFHVMDCVEMAGYIVKNTQNCIEAARNHPKGVVITTLANTRYTKIIGEASSLVNNISNFVKAKGKKNLLNSAERLKILMDTHQRLRKLNRETTKLYWEIKTLDWTDLGRLTNPDLYYASRTDERLYRDAKRRIDKMNKAWE